MKRKYTIKELSDAGSERVGNTLFFESLTSAKRFASRYQIFQGTTMVIEEDGERLALKEYGKWRDA